MTDHDQLRDDIEVISRAALTPRPVFLPEDRQLDRRVSQTFLKHYNRCPRSGYLYQLYKGEASTVEMQRGRALHTVIERATKLMIDMGEATIPPEVVKSILDEVLGETPVPLEEHDYLREAAYRWASEAAVDPSLVVACETLFTMDVGDYRVRCRVDYADIREDGTVCHVTDYKSGRGAASQEEVARVRADGTLHAKNFQLVLYALVLAHGVPVREEPCRACGGTGEIGKDHPDPQRNTRETCPRCDGYKRIEKPEPFPIAAQAHRFDLEFVYPGIEDREGKMLRRPVTLTRLELEEYRSSLTALVARVAGSERSGDWPAVVSDAACGECPAASECPIPVQVRGMRGLVDSVKVAAEVAPMLERSKADNAAVQRELRAVAKKNGGSIRYGNKIWELVYSESEQVTDRDGLLAAMDRAVRYGEPFDRADFVKVRGRTDFRARDLRPDEMSSDSGASNEGEESEQQAEVPF